MDFPTDCDLSSGILDEPHIPDSTSFHDFMISPHNVIRTSKMKWKNDERKSRILDAQLQGIFGFYESVRMNRTVNDVIDKIHWNHHGQNERMWSGSTAEGVNLPGSDIDVMHWTKHHIVIQERSLLPRTRHNKPNILLMSPTSSRPGYVRIECIYPGRATIDVKFSLVNIDGKQYFSSYKFKQFHLTIANQNARQESINGPCIRLQTNLGSEMDNSNCLRCHFWPDDAYEFFTRERIYGWPPEPLIQQILIDGIHLVPIGSKNQSRCGTWEHDSLEWRYSFSMAEVTLVHSFNEIQFRMYGLLKIITNDILKRYAPEDALCSYFMKTTIFWVIEETHIDLWRENNVIFLLDSCLKKFMDFVYNEYCPNFFIPFQNLFLGKIYGRTALQLNELLTRLYEDGYNFILHSKLLSNLQEYFEQIEMNNAPCAIRTIMDTDSKERECYLDVDFYSAMQCIQDSVPNLYTTMSKLRSAKSICESDAQYDSLIFEVAEAQYHRLSCEAGIAIFHSIQDSWCRSNKGSYSKLKEAIHYLLQSLDGDVSRGYLTIATVYYLLGNHGKALGFLKKVQSGYKQYVIYVPRKVAQSGISRQQREAYKTAMCGKNFTRHKKAKLALSFGFEAFRTMPVLPNELLPELLLVNDDSYILSIEPLTYSYFLSFLCHFEQGAKVKAKESFYHLLHPEDGSGFHNHILSIMSGICHMRMDNYRIALRYFCRAFIEKKHVADSFQYSGENLSWQSPLFYISILLNLMI